MYLVIGGTGFLGSRLVSELKKKRKVRVMSRHKINILGVEVVKGDISNYKDVEKAMNGCEVIFNLVKFKGHNAKYKRRYKAEVIGTQNVMKAALKKKAKVIHMSTTAVGMKFNTPYIRAKRDAEYVVRKFSNRVTAIIIRAPRIYDKKTLRKIFSFPLIPKIKVNMHFCHIDSAVDALVKASRKTKSGIYTIGDKKCVDFVTLAKKINPKVIFVPKIFLKPAYLLADITKLFCDLFYIDPPVSSEFLRYVFAGRCFDTKKAEKELKFKQFDTLKMI